MVVLKWICSAGWEILLFESPVILKTKTKPAKTEKVNSVVLVTADGSTASLC